MLATITGQWCEFLKKISQQMSRRCCITLGVWLKIKFEGHDFYSPDLVEKGRQNSSEAAAKRQSGVELFREDLWHIICSQQNLNWIIFLYERACTLGSISSSSTSRCFPRNSWNEMVHCFLKHQARSERSTRSMAAHFWRPVPEPEEACWFKSWLPGERVLPV